VAIDSANGMIADPPPETRLVAGGQLVMIGTMEQRATFAEEHER
jgi:K+/H+ antiporter YhaU regulatory subunit KhtT